MRIVRYMNEINNLANLQCGRFDKLNFEIIKVPPVSLFSRRAQHGKVRPKWYNNNFRFLSCRNTALVQKSYLLASCV